MKNRAPPNLCVARPPPIEETEPCAGRPTGAAPRAAFRLAQVQRRRPDRSLGRAIDHTIARAAGQRRAAPSCAVDRHRGHFLVVALESARRRRPSRPPLISRSHWRPIMNSRRRFAPRQSISADRRRRAARSLARPPASRSAGGDELASFLLNSFSSSSAAASDTFF
jgi:hypothetical protein